MNSLEAVLSLNCLHAQAVNALAVGASRRIGFLECPTSAGAIDSGNAVAGADECRHWRKLARFNISPAVLLQYAKIARIGFHADHSRSGKKRSEIRRGHWPGRA